MILEKLLRSAEHVAFFSSLFLSRLADQILPFPVPLVVFQTTQRSVVGPGILCRNTAPTFVVG
jgi:hypothetical protein